MSKPEYLSIVEHYERRLAQHGANWKGMDWPNEADLHARFSVMLSVAAADESVPVELLDLGCGVGLLLDHIEAHGLAHRFRYRGVDLSDKMIAAARARHAGVSFETQDVLISPLPDASTDYVLMNGVLIERIGLEHGQMEQFAKSMIAAAFRACRRGIAFNVMSAHVDWTREDLFHWPTDSAIAFLRASCTRHVVIRADYGLYEYTVYAYREPRRHA